MKGNIEFRDLYFSYPQRPDTHIFNGLSLCVPQGSVTAIVGSSGSGKSTLAALLLRYYDPDSGKQGLKNPIEDIKYKLYILRRHKCIW